MLLLNNNFKTVCKINNNETSLRKIYHSKVSSYVFCFMNLSIRSFKAFYIYASRKLKLFLQMCFSVTRI